MVLGRRHANRMGQVLESEGRKRGKGKGIKNHITLKPEKAVGTNSGTEPALGAVIILNSPF